MTASLSAVVRTTATITINGKARTSVLHIGPRGADGTGTGTGGPIAAADISDASESGVGVLTGTPAEGRAALGLGDSATRAVGTTAGTVAAGDDSRLSNARTPTAHGHDADDVSGLATVATTGAYADLSGRPTLGTAAAEDAAAFAPGTGAVAAPAALDGTSAAYNGDPLIVAAGSTLTIAAGAKAVLPAGVTLLVAQAGTATLAFAAGVSVESGTGTSSTSVTLAAGSTHALIPSPTAGEVWRLASGGAAGAPTAHAASHAAGESDAITPASIGAAPAGTPSAFTSRTLTDADDGDALICASSQTATVNTGLRSGFGCTFKGAVSFSGTATVTDVRTTGAANPWCALVQTGTDTYDAVGGKA